MSISLDPQGDRRLTARVLALASLAAIVIALPVLLVSGRLYGTEIVGRHADAYTMIGHFSAPPAWHYFTQPVVDWTGSLLGTVIGGTAAYNALVLTSIPLAAVTTLWLARSLGLSRGGATLAALAVAFSPFHLAHTAYHPHVAQVQWLPLYLLALLACVHRYSAARALGLLAAAALAVLSNFYAGLVLGVVTPVAIAAFVLLPPSPSPPTQGAGTATRHGRRRLPSWLATSLTLAAGAAAGWLYVRAAAPRVLADPERFGFPAADLSRYAARWWSYFVPPVEHAVLGGAAGRIWDRHGIGDGLVEQQVYLGFGLLALAAAGCLARWRREEEGAPGVRAVPALVVLGGAAFLASLGPVQRLPGGYELPRLSALLHPLLPMFRAYARFGEVLFLAVALTAGIGFGWLYRRGGGPRRMAIAAAIVAVFELVPVPWRWHWTLPTEAHRWADAAPEPMRILECVASSSAAASIRHVTNQTYGFLGSAVDDCGEPGLAPKLAALGYTHVLSRAGGEPTRGDTPGLAEVRRFADSTLLRVVAEPATLWIGSTSGLSWHERDGGRTWRWMGPRGLLVVESGLARTTEAALELELTAFHRPRRVVVHLDGEPVAELEVGTQTEAHSLTLRLAPGRHRLELRAVEPPDRPSDILGSQDTRELTVAVGSWSLEPLTAEDP
ncbi:MAG: hypothetical protein R3190_02735 [Thermoanaerobaculia bacterium]|nr:hypothetical protein [Thermoanaerobaculia bacterium]